MVSKWKRIIRKGHTTFLLFHFWDLKLVPIVPALNSVSGNFFIFFKNLGIVPRKAAKLENPVKIFLKCLLWSIAAKLENFGTKMFWQIYEILLNFDSNPLICDLTLLPGKNSPSISNNYCVFTGKGRGDRALILKYLDSPMAEIFPHYWLSFSILANFREKRVVKVGLKVQTFDPFLFYEN